MTPEEWQTARQNVEAVTAQRDALRVLLNRARQALPADHEIQPEIAKALGLAERQAA